IIIGAGIAALIGEIDAGGRLANTPVSLVLGSLICLYLMFSVSFQGLTQRFPLARKVVNYGMVPGILIAIFVGIATDDNAMYDIKFGFTAPAFGEMSSYRPCKGGRPAAQGVMLE